MPSKYRNIRGIVFKISRAKDADRVVSILTEQGDRQAVVAKGVRKASSRKAHAVDLLNLIDFKLVEGRSMGIMAEVKLIAANAHFKTDYPSLIFSQFICEVVDRFCQEGANEQGYYNNLINLMGQSDTSKLYLLAAAFLLRALYLSGELPKLNEDAVTGEQINPGERRYLADIGFVRYTRGEKSFPDRLYKVQRFILKNDFGEVAKLDLPIEEQTKLLKVHINWVEYVLDRRLKSTDLLLNSLR